MAKSQFFHNRIIFFAKWTFNLGSGNYLNIEGAISDLFPRDIEFESSVENRIQIAFVDANASRRVYRMCVCCKNFKCLHCISTTLLLYLEAVAANRPFYQTPAAVAIVTKCAIKPSDFLPKDSTYSAGVLSVGQGEQTPP